MKLKRLVEDFQVEEQISLQLGDGPFGLYRLTKQSLGTLEAVDAIRRKWELDRRRVSFAGLKDKHACTVQYLTIHNGPRKGFSQQNLTLDYLAQASRAIHASDIIANRFVVVIRDLETQADQRTAAALASIQQHGLPNYLDNQRFGSLGESGEFIAKPWCLGDYEQALRLVLTDPNAQDRPKTRDEKQILREHWGNWSHCLRKLANSAHRPLIEYLAETPTDFRRAIVFFPQELRSLWLAAFQSHLWNQILAALISKNCEPQQLANHLIGRFSVPFFQALNDQQRRALQELVLPLPSARLHLTNPSMKALYDQVLATEGMELREMRVKYPRDSFFSKGERAAIFQPGDFQHEFAADDIYAGRQKLNLRFSLLRGSYATIVVKRIVGQAADAVADC